MITGVVVGPPGPRAYDPTHWAGGRGPIVHARAQLWLGPACNLDANPETTLIAGQEVPAERVTCWACRHLDGEPCTDPACRPCHPPGGLTHA